MKIRSFAAILTALSLAVPPARATLTRVGVLGEPLLLPDAEGDLSRISAFIHDFNDRRLFGRAGWTWERGETTLESGGSSSRTRNRLDSFSGSVQYVDGRPDLPFALRYSPSYSELESRTSSSPGGSTHSILRERNAPSSQVLLGFARDATVHGALSVSYDEVYTRLDDGTGALTDEGDAWTVEGSALTGEIDGVRMAASLSGAARDQETLSGGAVFEDEEFRRAELKLVPEIPTAAGNVWRLLVSGRTDRTEAVLPGVPDNYETEQENLITAGVGWTSGPEDNLWHMGVLASASVVLARDKGGAAPSTNSKTTLRRVSWFAGAEKPLGRVVVGRVGVDLAAYTWERFHANLGTTRTEKDDDFSLAPTASAGLGIRATEDILVDVALENLTGDHDRRTFRTAASVATLKEEAIRLEASLQFRFR